MDDNTNNSNAGAEAVKTVSVEDELKVMAEVSRALDRVKADSQVTERIIRWISERYKQAGAPGTRRGTVGHLDERRPAEGQRENDFSDFATLFSTADPKSEAEKALVGGYWQQQNKGIAEWDSFSVNKELKHLGHGIANITVALDNLIGRRPQLVIQTRKSGKEKQARKLYKLTAEGIKRVNEMLSQSASATGSAA